MNIRWPAILATFLALLPAGARAAAPEADPLAAQRALFLQAREAIQAGEIERAQALQPRLAAYPLAPWLDLWLARAAMKNNDDARVLAALEAHPDIPEALDLRLDWLRRLA